MKKSKKAKIMVSFLLTILLAIIIFAPTCAVMTKFFRLSGQAKDNSAEFAITLRNFVQKTEATDSFLLILDDQTLVAGFNQGASEVVVYGALSPGWLKEGKQPKYTYLARPAVEECKGASCVCLIKSITKKEYRDPEQTKLDLKYEEVSCASVNTDLTMPNYDFVDCKRTGAATCVHFSSSVQNGFILGREVKESDDYINLPQFKERRNMVYLMKKEGKIFVCLEQNCQDYTLFARPPVQLPGAHSI